MTNNNTCSSTVTADKLAVFDMDGTLYNFNSHVEILNQWHGKNIYDTFLMKAYKRIFKESYIKMLYRAYSKIPAEYIKKFNPAFRQSALDILAKKRREGYHISIISNAPEKLIENAAVRLNTDWHKAEYMGKDKVVANNYKYNKLFVCTDNLSDINLLDMADERVIYYTEKTKDIFLKRYPDAKMIKRN